MEGDGWDWLDEWDEAEDADAEAEDDWPDWTPTRTGPGAWTQLLATILHALIGPVAFVLGVTRVVAWPVVLGSVLIGSLCAIGVLLFLRRRDSIRYAALMSSI